MLRKKSDFYREVSPPDQLSSLTQGTPIGRSDNPDGTNPHSALPNGDSARNIGRPSPDSPNLKYRNLDRAEANGRTPAEGQDFGYVHDSGSGSARVIPYDSGFANNGSALRKAGLTATLEQSLRALEERLEGRYQGLVLMTNLLSGGDEYEPPIVRIMTVQIPPDSRKQGLGSEVMSQIISWADGHGVMLSLSPSTDFGASSVSRLTKFYRRFGFKPNKGRNKDFRTRDTMLRNPSLRKSSASYKMPRKWDRAHCESKSCDEMGFSEKASCRPYVDCYGGEEGVKRSNSGSSRVASRYLESAKRDDPKMKNTGHGGLDTWFAGHGGGKPDDRATWGDWIAVTPVKHTIKKENGESKTYEAGDIVGPCAVSSEPSWASVTDGGKNPLKCMPRDKAHDLTKEQRATLARKKRREESKAKNGQKPVLTPTFSEEGKNMIEKKASKAPPIKFNKTRLPALDVLLGINYGTTDQLKRLLPEGFMEEAQSAVEDVVSDVTLSGVSPWSISSSVWRRQKENLNHHYSKTGIHYFRGDPKAGEIVHLGGTFSVNMTGADPHISGIVKCVFPLSYITIEERRGPHPHKRVDREADFYINIPVKIDLSNSDSFNDIYLMWLEGRLGAGKTASQMAVRVAKKYLRG